MFPSSRLIKDLHPRLRSAYILFDNAMRDAKIDYIITCTYRNNEDQQKLFDQGRTKNGSIVTNARPGESKHNTVDANGMPSSKAFDIVVIKNGKPDWDVKNPDWRKAGSIGKRVGLDWAGDWKSFKEYPHFQLTESE